MNPPATATPFAIQKAEPKADKLIEYIPFGSDEKIKLSAKIIQELVCIPTKTGKICDERDAIKFMMLCKARALNPFEGDCYLQGYDSQGGPQFSLITAHQCFLKRSEASAEFDGMLSGVRVRLKEDRTVEFPGEYYANGEDIVRTENGKHIPVSLSAGAIVDRSGDFFDEATEQICGAWAKVFFKNKKVPMFRALRLEAFKKPYGVWSTNPEGMIVKCAEADALRSSFPTKLGGLYSAEEMPMKIANAEVLPAELPPRQQFSTPNAPSTQEAGQASDGPGPSSSPASPGVPNETLGAPKTRGRKQKAQQQEQTAQADPPAEAQKPEPAPTAATQTAPVPGSRQEKVQILRDWLAENGATEAEFLKAAFEMQAIGVPAQMLASLGGDVLQAMIERYAEIVSQIQ